MLALLLLAPCEIFCLSYYIQKCPVCLKSTSILEANPAQAPNGSQTLRKQESLILKFVVQTWREAQPPFPSLP
jgi:hypothetical protein